MRFHSCDVCGQVFDREAEGSGREYLRHDCVPFKMVPRPGARQWKNMRPRKRTGPMLRVRRDGKVVR